MPPEVGGIPIWYQETYFWGLVAMSLTGIITILLVGMGKLEPMRWNFIDLSLLALLAYMGLRTAMMDFIPQSSWIQIIYLTGIYFLARLLWSSMTMKTLNLFILPVLVAGILQAGYGLGQLYGWWPSHHHVFLLTGSFFNPGPYSGWLACIVPLSVYGILQKKTTAGLRVLNYVSWIYLLLAILALIPASSRAAILAAITGSVVVAWPGIRTLTLWKRPWIRGAVAAVIIIGLIGLYGMKKDSADGRILIYKVTADMIASAPILGWGWDGFPKMYNNFQALYFQSGKGSDREQYLAGHVSYGFNELLAFTAEMGIIGLMLLSGTAVLLFRKWQKYTRNFQLDAVHILGLGVLAAWITFAMFSYPMSIPALTVIFPITVAGINSHLISGIKGKTRHTNTERRFSQRQGSIVWGLLIAGMVVYGFYWVIHHRPLVQQWMTANVNHQLRRYAVANSIYRKLFPAYQDEGLFLQYAGKSMSLDRQFYESAYLLERALFFAADPTIFNTLGKDYTLYSEVDAEKKKRAELLLTRAKYISPYKYYPRFLLAKYYQRTGQDPKAIKEAEALLAIDPKVTSPATQEIRQEMQQIIDREIFQTEIVLPERNE